MDEEEQLAADDAAFRRQLAENSRRNARSPGMAGAAGLVVVLGIAALSGAVAASSRRPRYGRR